MKTLETVLLPNKKQTLRFLEQLSMPLISAFLSWPEKPPVFSKWGISDSTDRSPSQQTLRPPKRLLVLVIYELILLKSPRQHWTRCLCLWQTQITLFLLIEGCFPSMLTALWNNAVDTVSRWILMYESYYTYWFWLWCSAHWKGKEDQ